MRYADYIGEKLASVPPSGLDAPHGYAGLFPHQDDLIGWALRRGRCAVIANLKRKERDAAEMADALSEETLAAVQQNVLGSSRESNPYIPSARVIVPSFLEAA